LGFIVVGYIIYHCIYHNPLPFYLLKFSPTELRLFLLVFGLPPLVHPDDPARAVLASKELVSVAWPQGFRWVSVGDIWQKWFGIQLHTNQYEYNMTQYEPILINAILQYQSPPSPFSLHWSAELPKIGTQVFKRLKLVGRFGVTTGRSYCGVCGSAKRMEYTVSGRDLAVLI
jgi:hypothetical protein